MKKPKVIKRLSSWSTTVTRFMWCFPSFNAFLYFSCAWISSLYYTLEESEPLETTQWTGPEFWKCPTGSDHDIFQFT